MPAITTNTMVRNEGFWIGYVLDSVLAEADHVLITDTGSTDNTVDIIEDAIKRSGRNDVKFEIIPVTTGVGVTVVRNRMLQLTPTDWLLLVDGDEIYPASAIREIRDAEFPSNGRLGFTNMNMVRREEDAWWLAETYSRCSLYYKPGMTWTGDYPWEWPSWWESGEGRFYLPAFKELALDFHHIPRSSNEQGLVHRRGTRPLQPLRERLELPLDLNRWPNPFSDRSE